MPLALVTGATGFIGRHLVQALVEQGQQVRCLVRASSRRGPLEALGVTDFALGDVRDLDSLAAACAGVDAVYHLAAHLKAPWRRTFGVVNAQAVGTVAQACAAQPRPPVLLVVSSLAAGGVARGNARDERHPARPVSRYGKAKLAGERAAAAHAGRVPITVVRPPMVFGAGDRSALRLFQMAARGTVVVPGGGAQLSLVHVADLADALIRAAERGERLPAADDGSGRGVYYVAAAETPTLPELGRLIGAALGRPDPWVIRTPGAMVWLAGGVGEALGRLRDRPSFLNLDKAREASAGNWVCSAAKARAGLGFAPAPLLERLAETIAGYRAEGWL